MNLAIQIVFGAIGSVTACFCCGYILSKKCYSYTEDNVRT